MQLLKLSGVFAVFVIGLAASGHSAELGPTAVFAQTEPIITYRGSCPTFSPDGTLLAVSTKTNEVHVLELPSGNLKHRMTISGSRNGLMAFTKHKQPRLLIAVRNTADGKDIEQVEAWNLETSKVVATYEDCGAYLAVSRDGQVLAASRRQDRNKSTIALWNLETDKTLGEIKLPWTEKCYFAIHPKATEVAVKGGVIVHAYDVPKGNELATWTLDIRREASQITNAGVCYSPDGKYVAGATCDVGKSNCSQLRIAKVDGLKDYLILESNFEGQFQTVDFHPDSTHLAVSYNFTENDKPVYAVKIWNIKDKKIVASIDNCQSGRFDPTGKYLATSGGGVKVWDVEKLLEKK